MSATKTLEQQHKLLMSGPPGNLKAWTCACACGGWSGTVPDVGPYGRTTAKARIAQVNMAHGKHVRFALRRAAKEEAAKSTGTTTAGTV